MFVKSFLVDLIENRCDGGGEVEARYCGWIAIDPVDMLCCARGEELDRISRTS